MLLDDLIKQAKLTSINNTYADPVARDKFYQSHTWRKKRAEILARDNYECQVAKSIGEVIQEKLIIHHIKPLEFFPELALDDGNLIVVSHYYHNIIHELITLVESDEWW